MSGFFSLHALMMENRKYDLYIKLIRFINYLLLLFLKKEKKKKFDFGVLGNLETEVCLFHYG